VIPVLNEQGGIAALLQDLRVRFPGAELLVVDGGSHDDTVRLALVGADAVLLGAPGRARQMNLGAAAAGGDYLLFLHADTRPEFCAAELCAELAQAPAWAFCQVKLSGPHRALAVVAWFMNRRSRLTAIATGDQLLMVRRDVFLALGGFADIALMEDIELCKRLRREAPPRRLSLRVETSSRRWEERGILRTVLQMWSLRLAYWLGASPQRLCRWYYGPADS
jgi:rSAM/selenodomain-associated transferase 2